VGSVSLADARNVARDGHAMLRKGIDAKSEQQKQRAELQQKQADTFAHVADALIKEHLSKGKKGGEIS
jgi:hypothetical protein